MGRRVYAADGWKPLQVWDGLATATKTAGIAGPSTVAASWAPTPTVTSASPGITVGTHLVRYRYLDSRTGYVSEASATYSLAAAGSQSAEFAINTSGSGNMIRSSDTKVDRIVVEMTLAGGVVFYKAGEVVQTASSIVVNISDDNLANQLLLWPDENQGAAAHLPPPIRAELLYHRGRLWTYGTVRYTTGTIAVTNGSPTVTGTATDWDVALGGGATGYRRAGGPYYLLVAGDARYYEVSSRGSATSLTLAENYAGSTLSGLSYTLFSADNRVFYSEAGYPESWPYAAFIQGPEQGRIRAAAGVLSGIAMYSLSSIDFFRFTDEPAADGAKRHVSSERGAVNARVVVVTEELAYALDRRGVHVFDGATPNHLSRPIDTLVGRINWTVEEKFHATYYPRLHAIRWWVALDADTVPKHYLQYDVGRQQWSMGEREVGVTCSALVPTTDGVRVLVGDENGYTWFDDEGETDGSDATPKLVVGSGSTTTVVQSATVLPTTGRGLAGVVAHHVRLAESRVISSNTSSAITVPAFSSAPIAGDVIQLGRVKAKLRPRALVFGGFPKRHKGKYLHVWFRPIADQRYFRVRVYRDYLGTAMTWGQIARLDPDSLAGCRAPVDADDTDWQVDASYAPGVVRIPLGDTSVRVTEVELEFRESDSRVEILGIAVDAIEQEAPV